MPTGVWVRLLLVAALASIAMAPQPRTLAPFTATAAAQSSTMRPLKSPRVAGSPPLGLDSDARARSERLLARRLPGGGFGVACYSARGGLRD
jgi:hypothetical protein